MSPKTLDEYFQEVITLASPLTKTVLSDDKRKRGPSLIPVLAYDAFVGSFILSGVLFATIGMKVWSQVKYSIWEAKNKP